MIKAVEKIYNNTYGTHSIQRHAFVGRLAVLMIKVGIAGTGAWARRTHLPALLQHPDVHLVGVWGRDGERARQLAAEFGVEAFPTFEQLSGVVDVVDIAVSPMAQAEIAMRAATAGRHLMLEKPLAMTSAEASAISRLVKERQVVAKVFLSRLFDEPRRAWLRSGADRQWTIALFDWKSAGLLGSSPAADDWRIVAGPLFDVGPHVLSQLELLLGEVTSVTSASTDERGAVDFSLVHSSGAHSVSHIDLRAPVAFTEERISLSSPGETRSWGNDGQVDFIAAFRLMVDDVIDDLRGRESKDRAISTLSGTVDGARVVRLLHDIHSTLISAPGA
jgi:hypothetical protein